MSYVNIKKLIASTDSYDTVCGFERVLLCSLMKIQLLNLERGAFSVTNYMCISIVTPLNTPMASRPLTNR